MRIGIYFTPSKDQGGVYTYSVAILEALSQIKTHRYAIISTSPDVPSKFVRNKRFAIIDLHTKAREFSLMTRDYISYILAKLAPWLIRLLYRLKVYQYLTPIYRLTMMSQIKTIEDLNLDLIFYPTSSNLSFLANIPAVVTVHDLQHRLNPQFPEVSAGGRWEHREYGFININQRAYRILVDSAIGKEDWLKFYPTNPKRVVVLPYLPPSDMETNLDSETLEQTLIDLKIPRHFIYYPAKFWPHKNHLNLLKSLVHLKKRGKIVNLVLTGSKEADFSSSGDVDKYIKSNNLDAQIFYLGFVSKTQLSALYQFADALIMPTFFGPTNIPILEAWTMGTPVIYSDIRGCREQLGNAGILANPNKPIEIAHAIQKVYLKKSSSNCQELISRGKSRVKLWTQEEFTDSISAIIKGFAKTK